MLLLSTLFSTMPEKHDAAAPDADDDDDAPFLEVSLCRLYGNFILT